MQQVVGPAGLDPAQRGRGIGFADTVNPFESPVHTGLKAFASEGCSSMQGPTHGHGVGSRESSMAVCASQPAGQDSTPRSGATTSALRCREPVRVPP